MSELNLLEEKPVSPIPPAPRPVTATPFTVSERFNPDQDREAARGDLARGLLWLLTFAIGGVLAFVGLGRLEGTVITQSIFPSLIALAGTALGFYFGSSTRGSEPGSASQSPASSSEARTVAVANAGPDQSVAVGAKVALRGSGSAGTGGGALEYTWSLTAIPEGSTAAIGEANGASATFTADKAGVYKAQLLARDGLTSASSIVIVTAA